MVCPCCFSFFIPGRNCIQNLYSRPQIRKLKEQKRKYKTQKSTDSKTDMKEDHIRYIIYSSQLFSYDKSSSQNKESLLTTFKCTKCKTLIVHDNTPLEFTEFKVKAIISKSAQQTVKPSRENLQKVLQKSQVPKASESGKKEMDLESFLNGFI